MSKTNLFKKAFFCILSIVTFGSVNIYSQITINSPYSSYGLGQIEVNNNPKVLSMGGMCYTIYNPYTVNHANPATYTAFDTTSFVAEAGIFSRFNKLQTNDRTHNTNYTTLNELVMGFPVTKWWGASIGLLPFSNMGYKISNTGNISGVSDVFYEYDGEGSLNEFYFGNAFKVTKDLSVGFNASFLYGSLSKISYVNMPDSLNFYTLKSENSISIQDLYFKFGAYYKRSISKDIKLNTAFVFNTENNLNSKQNKLVTQNIGLTSVDTAQDIERKGSILFPINIGFGASIQNTEKWLYGFDFRWQNWKNYKAFGIKDSLNNEFQISAGGQYNPNNYGISKYWNKVQYRFGLRYKQTYLELKNKKINEMAISVGLGLPLRKQKSAINIAYEIGQRGTTDNNLIKETFHNISISVSLYERWFIKSKYD